MDWGFLQNTLSCFGFGIQFRKWVQTIYTNIESCVINNGSTSQYFKIKAGIRQGCPLSALLFLLAVELLAIGIRSNDSITGINIGNKCYKITQLADDTTLFLKDINSLKNAIDILETFRKISGLKLNENKTEILQIGKPLTSNYNLFRLKWKKERIYALGTWFYKDYQQSVTETYESRLKILIDTLNVWRRRNLTWIGKITIIKTLCISKLNYAISNMETPSWFIDQCKQLLESFLWSGKPPRVKNEVITNDYDDGGLRMTNLNFYIKAQKINWIKQFLENIDAIPSKTIQQFMKMELYDYLKCTIDPINLPDSMPQFYKEILTYWFELKQQPLNSGEVQREVIWNNRHITIANKSLFIKPLYENGMTFISDILDVNGKFLNYNILIEKYGFNITEYAYTCLKHAIPYPWRKMLNEQQFMQIDPKNETVFVKMKLLMKPVKLLKSKQVYWMLNNENIQIATCKMSWFNKYFIEFSKIQWKSIFNLARSITKNTKLVEFQFKIIHRVYASDSYVSNFDNTVSKNCQDCAIVNNIPHQFVDCVKVQMFWEHFKRWLGMAEGHVVLLSTVDIIFGIPNRTQLRTNFCILHAKWFIHVRKLQKEPVYFDNFLVYFKGVLCIEKQLAVNIKNEKGFHDMFSVFT